MKKLLKTIGRALVLPAAVTFLAIEAIQALTIALPPIACTLLVAGALYMGARKIYKNIENWDSFTHEDPPDTPPVILQAKVPHQPQHQHTNSRTRSVNRRSLGRWHSRGAERERDAA